ncbi:N-acetylglucosamine kinase [Aeoliella sp.]|uniref:N-acetylglucosamine kinase n=1 Tax=Aeoliella sp. TaxID=2795800 RepID=UPI003CCC1506
MSHRAATADFCLVVDGGGTKTDCQVLERSTGQFVVLGEGRSSGSNPNAIGATAAAAAIVEAIASARQSARLTSDEPIGRAAIAVAGTVDDGRRAELERLLQCRSFAKECRVFPDVIPILAAAASTGPAAGLISGTGATAIARDASGDHVLAGGWGYLLGDEGSGYSVGREALRQTLLELETGVAPSQLSQQVAEQLQAKSSSAIKQTVYGCENHREVIASMAPIVLECAKAGDDVALRIVEQTIEHLEALLDRAAKRLNLASSEVPVAITGGLFKPGSPLRQPLERALVDVRGFAAVQFVTEPLECVRELLDDTAFSQPIRFVE